MGVRGIQAWDVTQLAALCREMLGELHGDFFQGFQAIHGKARAHHIHLAQSARGHGIQCFVGGRLQPALLAETRLVSQRPIRRRQVQGRRDGDRTGLATLRVGVTALGDALWQTVEGKQQVFASTCLLYTSRCV